MKLVNQTSSFSSEHFQNLVRQLNVSCPSVVSFVTWFRNTFDHQLCDCSQSIKSLIRAVAASSPVCGFIRPFGNVHVLVRELINGINLSHCPAKMKALQEECLVLFNVLKDLRTSSVLPTEWRPMFEELLHKSMAPFNDNVNPSSGQNVAVLTSDSNDDALTFSPNLPKVRRREFYLADAARRKKAICTKKHLVHSFLTRNIHSFLSSW